MNEMVCHKRVEVSALVRRRVAWRLAEGWELDVALAAEELLVSEAGWLAEDADFLMLVDGFRRLGERSREEVVDQLVEMAWLVLEEALLAGDPRVALFFLKEEFAGRRPAEVIAKAVLGPRQAGDPMTVFVPPGWHKAPVLGCGGRAARAAVGPLSTLQHIYVHFRQCQRRFARQPHAP